ncbi:hypothetical protein [Cognatishimia sp. F0-27]|nr:hypothetical protein [Cognatishimia sp. F0-27]MCC1494262.1 hypothetical protein [Cognatishimia sp. F0-27]
MTDTLICIARARRLRALNALDGQRRRRRPVRSWLFRSPAARAIAV